MILFMGILQSFCNRDILFLWGHITSRLGLQPSVDPKILVLYPHALLTPGSKGLQSFVRITISQSQSKTQTPNPPL